MKYEIYKTIGERLMKKKIYLFLTLLMILVVLLSCDHSPTNPSQTEATVTVAAPSEEITDATTGVPNTTAPSANETTPPDSTTTANTDATTVPNTTAPSTGETTAPDSTTAPSTGETTAPDSTTAPSTGETTAPDDPGVDTPPTTHTYTDFTAEEKAFFNEVVGLVPHFIPNAASGLYGNIVVNSRPISTLFFSIKCKSKSSGPSNTSNFTGIPMCTSVICYFPFKCKTINSAGFKKRIFIVCVPSPLLTTTLFPSFSVSSPEYFGKRRNCGVITPPSPGNRTIPPCK
jgi:hypothetical protein